MKKEITTDDLRRFETSFDSSRVNRVAMNAGRPVRWKVENSWGKERGQDGYYVMNDEWFGEFSYQILLDRKYFTPEQAAAFDTEPIVLHPWDPMGSLAW